MAWNSLHIFFFFFWVSIFQSLTIFFLKKYIFKNFYTIFEGYFPITVILKY